MTPEDITAIASAMGKLSHKKSPRSKEFYKEIGAKGGKAKRKKKKLSTVPVNL